MPGRAANVALQRGRGSVGRASPCQGEGRGFESRRPLQMLAGQEGWRRPPRATPPPRVCDSCAIESGSRRRTGRPPLRASGPPGSRSRPTWSAWVRARASSRSRSTPACWRDADSRPTGRGAHLLHHSDRSTVGFVLGRLAHGQRGQQDPVGIVLRPPSSPATRMPAYRRRGPLTVPPSQPRRTAAACWSRSHSPSEQVRSVTVPVVSRRGTASAISTSRASTRRPQQPSPASPRWCRSLSSPGPELLRQRAPTGARPLPNGNGAMITPGRRTVLDMARFGPVVLPSAP